MFDQLSKGKYALKVAHLQYIRFHAEFNILHDTALQIKLIPSDKILQEVVVVGNKPVLQSSDGKLTYNLANSVLATGSTLYEVISQMPGVKVNKSDISLARKGVVKVMINRRLIYLTGEDFTRYLQSILVCGCKLLVPVSRNLYFWPLP